MSQHAKPTVLVVEDVDWIRRGMKKVLQRLGYHVIEAADAAEAAAVALSDPPDVIVTDEELPTLVALVESVKATGPLSGIPVTIVNPDEEEGSSYGDIIIVSDFDCVRSVLNGASKGNVAPCQT